MARFGLQERACFQAVRAACGVGLDSIALRERVSRALSRYLLADAYCAMELDPVTTLPVHDVNHGWPREYLAPLVEDALFKSTTADTGFLTRQSRRALILDELVADHRPERDPYYRFHVLPFGYRHEIQFMCVSSDLPRALFTFNRRAEKGPFEARHLRLLEAVAPHVGTAMHAACVRAALEERPAEGTGLIVLGPDGTIELANAAGRRALDGSREAPPPIALQVFLGLLRRALREGQAPLIRTLSFTDPATRQAYRVIGETTIGEDGHPRMTALLEPARPLDSHVGLLRLGLTAREAGVVAQVLRDENLEAVAGRLGCASATVTKHLKNVFAKLGVGSRRELALRLMAGAPNLGAGPSGLP
jgi:DNA-binding CsgD family transcriptional regulator